MECFKVMVVGLLSFVLMLIVIGWISLLQWDTLTMIMEYTLPIVALVYIYKLYKLKE